MQQSPGLTDAGRSTLGLRQIAARTLKGFCRTSIPNIALIEAMHNPFRVGPLHVTQTQGCPTKVGNPGLHNAVSVAPSEGSSGWISVRTDWHAGTKVPAT